MRTENENVPAYSSAPGVNPNPINFTMGQKIAPRAGFAYDLNGDGKSKIYGSWGIFYDIFKLELPQGSFGGQKWISYYFTLDTPNFETVRDNPACPPTCSGTLINTPGVGPSVDFRAVSTTPGLDVEEPGQFKPMRSQELSFGYERQVGPVEAISVRYVHKQLDRGIEDVGDLASGGEVVHHREPGRGPGSAVRHLQRHEHLQAAGTGCGFPSQRAADHAAEAEAAVRQRRVRVRQAPLQQLVAPRELPPEPRLRQLSRALRVGRERTQRSERRTQLRLSGGVVHGQRTAELRRDADRSYAPAESPGDLPVPVRHECRAWRVRGEWEPGQPAGRGHQS